MVQSGCYLWTGRSENSSTVRSLYFQTCFRAYHRDSYIVQRKDREKGSRLSKYIDIENMEQSGLSARNRRTRATSPGWTRAEARNLVTSTEAMTRDSINCDRQTSDQGYTTKDKVSSGQELSSSARVESLVARVTSAREQVMSALGQDSSARQDMIKGFRPVSGSRTRVTRGSCWTPDRRTAEGTKPEDWGEEKDVSEPWQEDEEGVYESISYGIKLISDNSVDSGLGVMEGTAALEEDQDTETEGTESDDTDTDRDTDDTDCLYENIETQCFEPPPMKTQQVTKLMARMRHKLNECREAKK